MILTDSLDMVGVKLSATWGKTRQLNGSALQKKVETIVGPWKTGKFMPLSPRPFSLNTYVLSKIWFRCHSMNLREGDIKSINSTVKKWLYADLLIKPEENVLFRHPEKGGLGLINVKNKSKACLLRTFLEMSVNPDYSHSLFLSCIFRYFISKEDINCPRLPPYYNDDFFKTIINARDAGYNIQSMTNRQWYQLLMEEEYSIFDITTEERETIQCRVEVQHPDKDWISVWQNCRIRSFDVEMTTFAFKLLHDLLPSERRLSKILPNSSPICRFGCPGDPAGDLEHIFFECNMTSEVGEWLLMLAKNTEIVITKASLIYLEIFGNEPILWITVSVFKYLWEKRSKGKKCHIQDTIAHLQSELQLLESTKHKDMATIALHHIST